MHGRRHTGRRLRRWSATAGRRRSGGCAARARTRRQRGGRADDDRRHPAAADRRRLDAGHRGRPHRSGAGQCARHVPADLTSIRTSLPTGRKPQARNARSDAAFPGATCANTSSSALIERVPRRSAGDRHLCRGHDRATRPTSPPGGRGRARSSRTPGVAEHMDVAAVIASGSTRGRASRSVRSVSVGGPPTPDLTRTTSSDPIVPPPGSRVRARGWVAAPYPSSARSVIESAVVRSVRRRGR